VDAISEPFEDLFHVFAEADAGGVAWDPERHGRPAVPDAATNWVSVPTPEQLTTTGAHYGAPAASDCAVTKNPSHGTRAPGYEPRRSRILAGSVSGSLALLTSSAIFSRQGVQVRVGR
jgi:hypothetical protein